jgi:hypothetical protein
MDRYTKVVFTVIAGALVYLCMAITPLPALRAQTTQRPGEGMGPVQVVVVGWRAPANQLVPVAIDGPVRVADTVQVAGTVQVRGPVSTEPVERASRVVIAGYELDATRDQSNAFRPFGPAGGLPTTAR